MSLSIETRRLLARYCRDKRRRYIARDIGARWYAHQIVNIATGLPFGEPGSWVTAADSIEDLNIAINELILSKPPGAKAYWWLVPQVSGPPIYVKIQIGAGGGCVLGRSFHFHEY
jgi:hypothetical protein